MILLSSFLLCVTAGQLRGHARPLEGSKNVGDRNIKVNKGEQKTRMRKVTWDLYLGRTVGNSTVSAASCLDYVLKHDHS